VATKRKRRGGRTFGSIPERGNGLGAVDDLLQYEFDESWTPDSIGWSLTADPNIVKTEVPNDTPLDPRVVALTRDFPRAGVTSWYAPTTQAVATGKIQAAVDTIAATGAQLTAAGESVLGFAGAVVQNLPLILMGLAAVYLLFKWESGK